MSDTTEIISPSASRPNSQNNSRSSSPNPSVKLFKTNLKDNLLVLDKVILKETHVLMKFVISSLVPFHLRISFTALDLPADQIRFQTENENLKHITSSNECIQSDEFNQVRLNVVATHILPAI